MADYEVRTITDARALAAMANPHRSRILDVLAVDGPSTASAIAGRIDMAVGSASHHLKVLCEAGLVEEAPELAKDRRERWWRLVSQSTRWARTDFAEDAGAVNAALAAESVTLRRQFEHAQDWLANSGDPDDVGPGRVRDPVLDELLGRGIGRVRRGAHRAQPALAAPRDTGRRRRTPTGAGLHPRLPRPTLMPVAGLTA